MASIGLKLLAVWSFLAMFEKMSLSIGTVIGLLSVGLILYTMSTPSPAQSDDNKGEPANAQNDDETIKKLEARIAALEKQIADKADKNAVSDEIKSLTELTTKTGGQLKTVDENLTALKGFVESHGKWFDQISTMSGEKRVPSLLANMADDAFKAEMQKVVSKSVQAESQLFIKNETSSHQVVWVNEKIRVDLPAGTTSPAVRVPTGNVSTRVSGQRLMNWTLGPPTYKHRISVIERVGTIYFE